MNACPVAAGAVQHGTWPSLVGHLTGGQGVAGSNPAVPTGFRTLVQHVQHVSTAVGAARWPQDGRVGRMTELHEVGDDAEAAIPWAKAPDVTIICDIDNGRELLRMPGL